MGKFTSFFIIAIVAFNNEVCCENLILGTVAGSGHSEFGGGAAEQHYTNENGVVVSYSGYTNYEQKPNGECVKKVVEVKNGVSNVTEYPIDCEEAKQEIDRIAEKTRLEIKHNHDKILKQHYETLDKIQKQISEMQSNFPYFKKA